MSYFENLGPQFDQCISSVKEGKKNYILPPISLLLSFLLTLTGWQYFVLSLIYMINLSFFAYIVRDSYSIRKENVLPLLTICISIVLTSIQVINTLEAIAALANLGEMFSDFGDAFE